MLGNFFSMANNYEERAVARFEEGDLTVDTCAVTDSEQPYETGISHPAYNEGKWVIVQMYDSKEKAQQGHDEWVKKMTAKTLPESLKDLSTSEIKQFGGALGCDFEDVKAKK